jgi:hypothetical protein
MSTSLRFALGAWAVATVFCIGGWVGNETASPGPAPVGVCVDITGGLTGVETPVVTNGIVSCKDGSFVSAVAAEAP